MHSGQTLCFSAALPSAMRCSGSSSTAHHSSWSSETRPHQAQRYPFAPRSEFSLARRSRESATRPRDIVIASETRACQSAATSGNSPRTLPSGMARVMASEPLLKNGHLRPAARASSRSSLRMNASCPARSLISSCTDRRTRMRSAVAVALARAVAAELPRLSHSAVVIIGTEGLCAV